MAEEGNLYFSAVIMRSRNSLLRVVLHDEGETARVRADLEALGCSTEWLETRRLIAVNVPGNVRLRTVQRYLGAEEEKGTIGWEEPILRHADEDVAPPS